MVDTGSSDESPSLDGEYEGVTILRLPRNIGATKAMNIATRTAKGEFVFFLTPEVEVSPDTAARLAAELSSVESTVAVCPLIVEADGKPVSHIFKIPSSAALKEISRGGSAESVNVDETQESVPVQYASRDALMVRRQNIQGMNYFDARFGEFGADLDLAMRIRSGGRKILLYPSIRVTYYPMRDPMAGDPLLIADRAHGAAVLTKYRGFFSGLLFRIGAVLRAIAGLNFRQATAIASWQQD